MFKRLSANTKGRDYIVGDIHFRTEQLYLGLNALGFDYNNDRLITVGDVVDRGPDVREGLELFNKPWFHSVRGNHEWMLIEAFRQGPQTPSKGNGADWWLTLDMTLQQHLVRTFEQLPIAIEIDSSNGTVGVVHADVPKGISWGHLTQRLGRKRISGTALWSSKRVKTRDHSGVSGAWRVCVGHTTVDAPTRLGNVLALDTTGGLGGSLAFYCPSTDLIFMDGHPCTS
ncbi:metallophosphoesterase [Pseudomonas sp. KnCO4]|uniref:metallophosphoesterase n=1 Tax=Pseudomonas sp. KnCO4 TaxID=3381355 RepID=UPI003877F51F